MSEGVSYEWTVDSSLPGMDETIRKLRLAESSLQDLWKTTIDSSQALHDLGKAAKEPEDEFRELRDTLEKLKLPGKIETLKKEIADFGKPVKVVNEDFKGVGQAVNGIRAQFTQLTEFAGIALLTEGVIGLVHVFERATSAAMNFGEAIVKAAAGDERTEKVFQLRLGNKGADRALGYSDKVSPFSEFTDLKPFESTLLRAGVPLEKLHTYIAAAGDVAAGSENKIEGMTNAVMALGEMFRSGKLSGRSLRGLNLGVEDMKALPEFSGKTDAQLAKVIENGTLTRVQVLRMIAGSDGLLGDKALEMSKTMGAKLDKLMDLPNRLYGEFSKSTAFDDLKGKIDGILAKFDPSAPDGKRIIDGIAKIGDALVHILDGVDLDEVLKDVLAIIETLPAAIKTVAEAFKLVGFGIHEAHEQLAPRVEQGKAAEAVQSGKGGVGAWFAAAFGGLSASAATPYGAGFALPAGQAKGMEAGTKEKLVPAAEKLIDVPNDITVKKGEIHSPSKLFERLGRHVGDGFALGIGASAAGIGDAMESAFTVPAPRGGRAPAAGMGDVYLTIEVPVHGSGGQQSARELGQAVGDAVRTILPSALADAFEQMNASGGNA